MKFRKDFVTNSSSSSYTCDICGATESGWDISLEEAGMVECVNGHTICNDELLEIPRKELSTDSPVTFDEIGNGYIYIEKVREDYTRHTRTVTKKDSNGNTYTETEVYYSWDYVSSEHLATDTIVFLDEPFSYGTITLPVRRLNLADAGVEKQRWNYIYKNSDTRYYYNVTDVSLVGTVFATLSDGTIKNASSLYENDTPTEVIESVQQSETLYLIFFWLAWVVFMVGCVYGFLYLENRWLD